MEWYFVGAISSNQSITFSPLILSQFLLLMNTYSPDIYDYILKEYEDSGYKLFYDMFGVLDNNEPLKIFEGD